MLHNEEQILKQSYIALGTIISFTASHSSKDAMHEAFALALQEITRLEKIFSRHDTSSALSALNTDAKLSSPPKELLYLLEKSIEIATLAPLYNPAIKPLLDLFESHQDQGETAKAIDEKLLIDAKEKSILSEISLTNNAISFNRQGMGITLDSIAKGYIIDCASAIFLKNGIENHIINAGGDIIAHGHKAPNIPWVVGIEDPHNPTQYLSTLPLINEAIATSGAYQRFYDKDYLRHHIINPENAQSPKNISTSCKAPTAMLADAYATACNLSKNHFDSYKII